MTTDLPAGRHTHLALALDGAGWHPAAWREPDAEPERLFESRRWVEIVQEAERGLLDFVTIEDSLALQSNGFGSSDEVEQTRVDTKPFHLQGDRHPGPCDRRTSRLAGASVGPIGRGRALRSA